MALDKESVLAALRTVKDPELFKDIVTLGMVKDVKVDGSNVMVHVELTTPACPLKETIKRDVEAAVKKIGAQSVHIELSANTRSIAANFTVEKMTDRVLQHLGLAQQEAPAAVTLERSCA